MFLTIFALVAFLTVSTVVIEGFCGLRSLQTLSEIAPEEGGGGPTVSLVLAARNEQKNIEAALSSLTRLDYPGLQIVAVNDRSTDRTGEILDALARREPRLQVKTVSVLPEGWLGKNHALFLGAQASRGDLILFTDADIVMDPTVLRRAVSYLEKNRLDHLAIGPQVVMPGVALKLFITGFSVFFNMFARPWRVRVSTSKAHIGIGAFNLIRRAAYEKIGTHQAIAMRPDDDLKLGKLVKKFGLKQDFLIGVPLIRVEWYDSVRALIEGLMKNAFAGVDYKLSVIIIGSLAHLIFIVWPFVAVFALHGPARALYGGVILLWLAVGVAAARVQRLPALYSLGLPPASLLFLYIIWKATLRTLIRGGIEWRGTFYPLKELKKNAV